MAELPSDRTEQFTRRLDEYESLSEPERRAKLRSWMGHRGDTPVDRSVANDIQPSDCPQVDGTPAAQCEDVLRGIDAKRRALGRRSIL